MPKKSLLAKNTIIAAWIVLLVAAVGVASNPVPEARLSLPTVVASAGDSVNVSVDYRARGAAVSSLILDIHYDPSALSITPTIGSAAAAAGKVLYSNVLPAPDGQALLRILVFGINRNVIGDGDLADLAISVSPSSTVGPHRLDFLNVSLASPDAVEVPSRVHFGQVITVGPR